MPADVPSAVPVLADGAAGALVLVVGAALVVSRRRAGQPAAGDVLAAASEEETTPLVGGACARAERGGARARAPLLLLLVGGLALLAGLGVRRRLFKPSVRPPAPSALEPSARCMTSDDALLRGAYDVPGVGDLGLPPPGTAMWAVRTRSASAQRLFDQGVLLLMGFNHPEAIRNLEAATRADGDCGMCWWALAYAHGPHVNMALDAAHSAAARRALERALALADRLPAREAAYVRALEPRYALDEAEFGRMAQRGRDAAFSRTMAALHAAEPEDAHAAALYAESVMDLFPWDYYEARATQGFRPPSAMLRAECAAAKKALERALAVAPHHPLALHLLVHLTEPSADPAAGELAATRLLYGAAGRANAHLVHMAGHTMLLIGRYADAIDANARAIAVDEAYAARCLQPYLPGHQIAQLQAAAMLSARAALALERAAPAATVDAPSQAAHLQSLFATARPLVRARFGQWDAVLGADAREDAPHAASIASRPFTAAVWSYARTLALAHSARRDDAAVEAARLAAHVAAVPARTAMSGHVFDGCHHQLGTLMLLTVRAALALPADPAAALARMREASAIQDALPYMEPEHWYTQVRLCEGALHLRAGDARAALRAFDEDLRQRNESAWALLGRRDALRALGDARAADADVALARGMRDADVQLRGPCCELGLC
ncbi:hypothetical protein KFE25_005416 [Diacronema lutheri]|uniref:Uncharacterized protein n=2 Tax=Diacronema lutheri TaxID=2081491 RepID=A0A8J6CC90_DIALT|nr:hypothetical protein KFE25_005416 [Diacronema lutheri]